MKLPVYGKRRAKGISTGEVSFELIKSDGGITVLFPVDVHFGDGDWDRNLPGWIYLSLEQVQAMYKLVESKRRAKRKQCPHGHAKDVENTVVVGHGRAVFRTCYLSKLEKQKAKRAAKV